jgi:hypothetical protein
MINDLTDLIKIQSKNIEHYNKYPIALIFFIMLILVIPTSFLTSDTELPIASVLTDLLENFLLTFVEVIFFVYWFGRIGKNHTFLSFLHYNVMLSIAASIPTIAILLITQNFEPTSWIAIIGGFIAISYIIYMFSVNLALATGSSKKYAFGAILIVILIQIIFYTFIFSALVS